MVAFLQVTLFWCFVLGTVSASSDLHDNSPGCDCYVTQGSSSEYYLYHRFFDFRDLHGSSELYDSEPPNVTNSQDPGQEISQRGYLNSTDFAKDWNLLTWGRGSSDIHPVPIRNSRQNIYIEKDPDDPSTTHLTLRTHRNPAFSSTAELESLQRNLFHASIRLHARVYGALGAVAGMFTYLNDSCESDIEILTRDPPNHIRYTNQPDTGPDGYDIPASNTDATLPNGFVWTDWTTHRIDWTPNISVWYANDVFVSNKTYGIPQFPSYLTINMWSNGGNWSYNMTTNSAAYLQIQWIDMVFNTSGPATGLPDPMSSTNPSARLKINLEARSSGCGTVCAVDNIQQPGFPEIVHKGQSSGQSSDSDSVKRSKLFWVWSVGLALTVILGVQAHF